MSLPAELRIRIYEFVLISKDFYRAGTGAGNELRLLLCSRQIRSEALPIYFDGCNLFILHLDLDRKDSIVRMCQWLERVIGTYGLRPFGAWKIRVSGMIVMRMLPLLQVFDLLRKTGISTSGALTNAQLQEKSKEIIDLFVETPSLFIRVEDGPNDENRSVKMRELGRLVKLAEKASRERWDKEMFADQYRYVLKQRVAFNKLGL